jgi:hypothetical protein
MVVACAVSLCVAAVDSLYWNHSIISHLRHMSCSMIWARFWAYFKVRCASLRGAASRCAERCAAKLILRYCCAGILEVLSLRGQCFIVLVCCMLFDVVWRRTRSSHLSGSAERFCSLSIDLCFRCPKSARFCLSDVCQFSNFKNAAEKSELQYLCPPLRTRT